MSSGPCLWECLPASFLQWCYTSSTIHAGLKNCSIFHLSILFVALSNFSHISKHPSCSCYLHSALTVCHISLDPSSKLSSFNTGCHVYSLHPLAEQRWLSTESQALRDRLCQAKDFVLETCQSWPEGGHVWNHFSYWEISARCHLFFRSRFSLSHGFHIYPPAACIFDSVIADSVLLTRYARVWLKWLMRDLQHFLCWIYTFGLHPRLFGLHWWSLPRSLFSFMVIIMLCDKPKHLLGFFLPR